MDLDASMQDKKKPQKSPYGETTIYSQTYTICDTSPHGNKCGVFSIHTQVWSSLNISARMLPIQEAIGRAIRDILGFPSNHGIKTANEDSSIPFMAPRAIVKLESDRRESNLRWISHTCAHTTRMSEIKKWLRTFLHPNTTSQIFDVVTAMTAWYTLRKVLELFLKADYSCRIVGLWKPVLRSPANVAWVHMPMKLQIGSFFLGDNPGIMSLVG